MIIDPNQLLCFDTCVVNVVLESAVVCALRVFLGLLFYQELKKKINKKTP